MRKEKLFHLLVLLGFTLLSMTISAQTDSRDVYGWLRYDDYNQDEYGICKFKTDAANDIQPVALRPSKSSLCRCIRRRILLCLSI